MLVWVIAHLISPTVAMLAAMSFGATRVGNLEDSSRSANHEPKARFWAFGPRRAAHCARRPVPQQGKTTWQNHVLSD
ncbi:hypothetical protein OG21DRAFT_1036207 [Imleria badia]|nr:hypothetical protein OG21DRAFT_1036207 [Imleria badia]